MFSRSVMITKEESIMVKRQTVLAMAVMAALLTPAFGGYLLMNRNLKVK